MFANSDVIECYVTHILCSSLIFCEDVDVEITMLGDVHKKTFAGGRDGPGPETRRSTQLHLFNYELRLKEPIDDIAPNVDYINALLGEKMAMAE